MNTIIEFPQQLNTEQKEAVSHIEGPLLIIAGAGSGKTRAITYRIAQMLSVGIAQRSILALTFTNKAAREMAGRVKQITGKKLTNLTVSTFHAFGVMILREEITALGYRKNFSIYDQADQRDLLKNLARDLKMDSAAADIRSIQSLFSAIKTGRKSWNEYNEIYAELYREYHEHMKLFNAVDFDDLIILPLRIFSEQPAILVKYRERYRYIMVDEFQDTSFIQYKLVRLLAAESRNLCVVGDDDQSIYSWRGANYTNLLEFEKDFPDVKEIKLEQNYRSTDTILQAANGLIANNRNRKQKNLWTGMSGGKSILLNFPQDEKEEAEFIAETIKTLTMRENLPYHDFGVLIRTNSLSRSIETAFMAENIPFRMSGGTSFYERKEVKDLIAYLRLMVNPDDDVSFLRVINTPRRGIGKKTLSVLNDTANRLGSSLYGAAIAILKTKSAPLSDRLRQDLSAFMELINTYRERFNESKVMHVVVKQLTEEMDYWGHLIQDFHENMQIAKYKYDNMLFLIKDLKDWESNPDNSSPKLFSYLNRIGLISRDDLNEDDDSGKVNLMTIHSAKGLEFNVVFLAGVEDEIIPHARSIEENPENIEEERRLFYVAITRAKTGLYLSSCRKRTVMRSQRECIPSPFLEEIPDSIIEYGSVDHSISSDEAEDFFKRLKQDLDHSEASSQD